MLEEQFEDSILGFAYQYVLAGDNVNHPIIAKVNSKVAHKYLCIAKEMHTQLNVCPPSVVKYRHIILLEIYHP